MNLPLYFAEDFQKTDNGAIIGNKEYILMMDGDFQAENAALAVKCAEILREKSFDISNESICFGLANAKNIARFEWFGEDIVLDGGHNPHGAEKLVSSLKKLNRPICLCVAMMEDKEYTKVAKILSEVADNIVTTQIDMPRCASAKTLAEVFSGLGVNAVSVENPETAVETALKNTGENGVVCICGSLYLAGRVRKIFKNFLDK